MINPKGQIEYDLRQPAKDYEEQEFQRIAESLVPGEIVGELEPDDMDAILVAVDKLRRHWGGGSSLNWGATQMMRDLTTAFDKAEARAINARMAADKKAAQDYAAEAAAEAIYPD